MNHPGDPLSLTPNFSWVCLRSIARKLFQQFPAVIALCLLGWGISNSGAQTTPIPQDPLISMLLAQPRVEISNVVATASFDPPVVRPGDEAFYRLTFTGLEQSIELPREITSQPRLQFVASAHGQILQPLGPKQIPLSGFNFRVRPGRAGNYDVPEFTIEVYGKSVVVPASKLEVTATPAEPIPPAQQLYLDMPVTNLFVGQTARVRVRAPGSAAGGVQALNPVQFPGQGYIVEQLAVRQSIQPMPFGQAMVPTYIYETTLRPITAGTLTVFAQAFTTGNRFSGPVVISGNAVIPSGAPQYALLESDPIEMQVKPLPRRGELPGFTGAVGTFSVEPPKLSTNVVSVGEPVRLSVVVRSMGDASNLPRLVPPPAPKLNDWQILAATLDGIPPQIIEAQGFTSFHFTLVPLSEQTNTPAIPFSFFDPTRAVYADLTIPSVSITVSTGAAPTDLKVLLEPTPAPEEEERLVLSGLAVAPGRTAASLSPWQQRPWFPLVQLAPAFVFLALWGWDQRRRYLEQHPDIVVRRRARRALRRQRSAARKAALAGDAARFASAAVNAMQVGCAPHFPADPRALVGADILQVLHHGNGNGSERADEIVRRFFGTNDVARFTVSTAETSSLLSLQPELETLLEQLEARL